jgi:chromosome segregation ATPase
VTDLAVEILKQIRDEVKQTNERLDATRTELSGRLDATRTDLSSRLDATRTELSGRLERLERRQTETEVRLATELVAVATAVRDLRDVLLEDRKLRETVASHETRIAALERHTG